MADPSDHLRAARETARQARQLDMADSDAAEEYWAEAERQYVEAGLDSDWFDDAGLIGRLDEPNRPLTTFGVVSVDGPLLLHTEEDDPVTAERGIVTDFDSVVVDDVATSP